MKKEYHKSIDFQSLNQRCCANWQTITAAFSPYGKLRGREYQALNPHRKDATFGSFGINVKTGRWADFSSGDAGGDFIGWVAFLRGITNGQAAQLIINLLGQ